ncbi:MAG: uL15 family ribosomal protein [bacterium]
MQLNELKRKTENKDEKRVGRGGIRGKTSGRGTKGQKARSGHRIRPDIREQLKKIPKLRGRGVHGLRTIQTKPLVLNVSSLETLFAAGDTVTPQTLIERGILHVKKGTALPKVKILGTGEIVKKISISGCMVSKSAQEKVEKAGGSVQK